MTKRILIVDDEFGIADIVAEILTEHGYTTSIAINGRLALASMAEHRPDLVLLDVMMPVLDGIGTLTAMRADSALASVPVIMMTALPEALPKDRSLYQAALHKPFSEEQLFEWIHKLLPEA
ncbi:MAG: response regulator receiver protein [Myxococcaceae bacterium]|nr:response regulator receiver protein [Myxococcaceae bacterium]